MGRLRMGLLLAGALGIPAASWAFPVTAAFTGEVLPSSLTLPPELIGLVAAGSPVSGTFSYDTATADSWADPTRAEYLQAAGFGITLSLGGASISTDPSVGGFYVQILDGYPLYSPPQPTDRFGLISHFNTAIAPASVAPGQLQIFFQSADPNGIQSDSISELTRALIEGTLKNGYGQVVTVGTQQPVVFINFRIDTVQILSLPEPGPAALLALGVGALAGVARRRPRRRPTPRGGGAP